MSDGTKSFYSAFAGLIIGVVITYLGIEKLTGEIFDRTMDLGEIRTKINTLQEQQESLSLSLEKMLDDRARIEEELLQARDLVDRVKRERDEISIQLNKLKETDQAELASMLDSIKQVSSDTEAIVVLEKRVSSIGKDVLDIQNSSSKYIQIGSKISLSTYQWPNVFVRHKSGDVKIAGISSNLDKSDSTFVIRKPNK
jgi:seryl-tRNA synthetase